MFLENSTKANLESSCNEFTRWDVEGEWMATFLKFLQIVWVSIKSCYKKLIDSLTMLLPLFVLHTG